MSESYKGLRDLKTLQTLVNSSQSRQRHKLAGRFARLENERARLERELGMWETRKRSVEKKLKALDDEIDVLRPLLLEDGTPRPGRRPLRKRPASRRPPQGPDVEKRKSNTISLEY